MLRPLLGLQNMPCEVKKLQLLSWVFLLARGPKTAILDFRSQFWVEETLLGLLGFNLLVAWIARIANN